MKIAIDGSRYFTENPTGVGVYSQNLIPQLINILIKQDNLVKLLVQQSQERLSRDKFNDITQVVQGNKLWTQLWLSKYFLTHHTFDALYVPSHTLPLVLPKRSYLTIHDVGWKQFPEVYSLKERTYLEFTTKFALKNATKIFVDSFATKDQMCTFYNLNSNNAEKIIVIHNGFDKEQFVNFTQTDILNKFLLKKKGYILVVGRIESKKNFHKALEAFSIIKQEYPDLRLVFAGRMGFGGDTFDEKCKQLNLTRSEDVIVTNYISNNDLKTLYESAAVLLHPSLLEGFGFTPLEAFSFKIPVACSNTTSLPEVGGKGALYFDPTNKEDIADKIKSALKLDLDDDIFLEQQKSLLKFSWKKTANEIAHYIINN